MKVKLVISLSLLIFLNISLLIFVHIYSSKMQNHNPKIKILKAVYAANCKKPISIKEKASEACNGKQVCDYLVESSDPAPGCSKDLTIHWSCGDSEIFNQAYYIQIDGEASGKTLNIKCSTISQN